MINKKKLFKMLVFVLGGLVVSLFALCPIDKQYDNVNWMSDLADDTIINEMSIPGTHNAGAKHSLFDVSGKCQDMTIKNQLKIGVRFLDIRLQLVNNKFMVVHDFVNQKLAFSKVLEDIDSYIKNNPGEFLIISLKEDADPKSSNLDFDSALVEVLSEYQTIVLDNSLPNILKEARGKIYILNRFDESTVGIPARSGWRDSASFEMGSLYVQDYYSVDTVEAKKTEIINAINYAQTNDKLVINFTSCYIDGGFPPMYAGTPASVINPWLFEVVNDYDNRLGVVLVDFITEELAREIYMRN